MQGVFLHGKRSKTKKALRQVVDECEAWTTPERRASGNPLNKDHVHDPFCVSLEATSMFGNEYDGPLAHAPRSVTYSIVGPDPYKDRKWYATIRYNMEKERWIVK